VRILSSFNERLIHKYKEIAKFGDRETRNIK